MSRQKKGPILSVRTLIEDENENILIVKRKNNQNHQPGSWSFPGGIVNFTESPEEGVVRLVKDKTGLKLEDLDFLNYQNSMPSNGSELHCLNMYFKAKSNGFVKLDNTFDAFAWIPLESLETINLAFNGNEAIDFYKESKEEGENQLWTLVNEAGSKHIPVTRKRLIDLQAMPGFFTKMEEDLAIYDLVKKKVTATLEIIKSSNKRNGEPIIVQIQSRTKNYDSTLEKMIRKGSDGIPRHYTTFDDMTGARAVVSFLKDVYTVRNKLLEFPEYTLREEEDYIKTPKNTGYRALHLTLEVPLPGLEFIPRCEIQIKTAYQHSWSNATHELTYKKEDVPPEHQKTFIELSEKLWDADQIAENLRHDIEHLNN